MWQEKREAVALYREMQDRQPGPSRPNLERSGDAQRHVTGQGPCSWRATGWRQANDCFAVLCFARQGGSQKSSFGAQPANRRSREAAASGQEVEIEMTKVVSDEKKRAVGGEPELMMGWDMGSQRVGAAGGSKGAYCYHHAWAVDRTPCGATLAAIVLSLVRLVGIGSWGAMLVCATEVEYVYRPRQQCPKYQLVVSKAS